MDRYQIVETGVETFHAGRKAPRDVMAILDGCGFQRLAVHRELPTRGGWERVAYLFRWLRRCLGFCGEIPRHAIVFCQYPNAFIQGHIGRYLLWCARVFRQARIITLLHDIDALRESDSIRDVRIGTLLRNVLRWSDAIIVHNRVMREWLAARGVPSRKMVVLRLFDYLADGPIPRRDAPCAERTVAIAGNLDPAKSGYLRNLGEIPKVKWHLYGPNFDADGATGNGVLYKGSFPPEYLPSRIRADYGLVWDGDSLDTCHGAMGAYLRYNTPHKLSLYLASGLPVIVWNASAMAGLVADEGLGITVASLREIGDRLDEIDAVRYHQMREKVAAYAERLRRGEFLREAVQEAVTIVSKK